MKLFSPHNGRRSGAFSLVEALITIAILGVISSLVVTVVTNASRDAARMVARQQQAAMQTAVAAWVSAQSRDTDPLSATVGQMRSLETIRGLYNAATTTSARFNKIKDFLDDNTADHFLTYTTSTDKLKSEALTNAKQYLRLDDWSSGSYPKVSLINE